MENDLKTKHSALIHALCLRHDIDMLILFGSSASETGRADSDIDLAVKSAIDKPVSKLRLIQEMEPIFEDRRIDLTVLTNNTDPLLLFEIFSNGRPLFQKTKCLFETNRLKSWHLYLDTMPLREYEKTYNKKRVRALNDVT